MRVRTALGPILLAFIITGVADEGTPFVAPEELERRLGVRFLARLGANESVFGPSPVAIEAMKRAVEVGAYYGDPNSTALREGLANLLGGGTGRFLVGPGIDGLLLHLVKHFLGPGKVAVTTLGSYPTFEYAANSVGARIVRVGYRDNRIDLEALSDAARRHNADVVYLANPDNPSGSFHGSSAILGYIGSLPDSATLLLDEAYSDFVDSKALLPRGADLPRVIRLRTFSKAHGMAGLRIGYAMSNPELLRPINRIRGHFEVNSVAQAGALASLNDPSWIAHVVHEVGKGRLELAAILSAFGLKPLESHTNFVTAEVGSREQAEQLLDRLLKAGVFIRKPGQPPLDACIRVTVGRREDHAVLRSALERMAV